MTRYSVIFDDPFSLEVESRRLNQVYHYIKNVHHTLTIIAYSNTCWPTEPTLNVGRPVLYKSTII